MVAPYWGNMPAGGVRPYGGQPYFGVWNKQDCRFVTNYKGKNYKVARLVCEAFNGTPPAGAVCMHIDENPANNKPDNLEWGTQKENLNAEGFLVYRGASVGWHSPSAKAARFKAARINELAQE